LFSKSNQKQDEINNLNSKNYETEDCERQFIGIKNGKDKGLYRTEKSKTGFVVNFPFNEMGYSKSGQNKNER
jgi:hypothetical protein